MEPVGAFLESEWDFLNKMFANEEVDFTPQFAACQSSPILFGQGEELHLDIHPTFCPADQDQADMSMAMAMARESENLFYSVDAFFPNGVGGGNVFFVNPTHPICPFNTKLPDDVFVHRSNCLAVDISVDEIYVNSFNSTTSLTDILREDTLSLGDNSNGETRIIPHNQLQPSANLGNQIKLKRKLEVQDMPVHAEGKSNTPVENQNKKPRASRDVRRSKRNTQPKKTTQNQTADHASFEDDTDFARASDLQSSSSCSAEDQDNTSHDTNGVVTSSSSNALNSNGKARASRGSATDPQSLYARRRRERINERLKILQNLVPNGTKVDISTMLEEAVHYVKFLQLQIKLLSSDDLWMYAPIANNGMDIALNLSNRLSSSL